MQTHRDDDSFMQRLRERADNMAGQSEITAGKDDEEELASWKAFGIGCRILPDDEQGITRITVGGIPEGRYPLDYLVIRGNPDHCIEMLRRAIQALEARP